MLTSYQFASNRPIKAVDIDGLEAWDGKYDAKDVFSLKSYQEFLVGITLKLTSRDNEKMFDCADLALYVWAKYHEYMQVDFTYTIPGTNQVVSSGDKKFNSFEDFYEGFVQEDDGLRKYGLRDVFGAKHLNDPKYGLTYKINYSEKQRGDLFMDDVHTMIYISIDRSNLILSIEANPDQFSEEQDRRVALPKYIKLSSDGLKYKNTMRWVGLEEKSVSTSERSEPIQKMTPITVTSIEQ